MTENTADQSGADERAKFEFYLTSVCLRDLQELSTNEYGEYDDDEIDASWNSWKAALASTQPAPQEPVAWIWKYANGEEEVVFIDASKRTWDYENEDVPSKITPLYATPQPFPAPAVQSGELPPLPEEDSYCTHADCHEYDVYTADQMRDYARKAIAAQTAGAPIARVTGAEIGYLKNNCIDELLPVGTELYAAPPTQAIAQTAPAVAGEAWISVKDALPDLHQEVLVYCGYLVCGSRTNDEHDPENQNGWVIDYDNNSGAITHWKPIAAPSQGAKQ